MNTQQSTRFKSMQKSKIQIAILTILLLFPCFVHAEETDQQKFDQLIKLIGKQHGLNSFREWHEVQRIVFNDLGELVEQNPNFTPQIFELLKDIRFKYYKYELIGCASMAKPFHPMLEKYIEDTFKYPDKAFDPTCIGIIYREEDILKKYIPRIKEILKTNGLKIETYKSFGSLLRKALPVEQEHVHELINIYINKNSPIGQRIFAGEALKYSDFDLKNYTDEIIPLLGDELTSNIAIQILSGYIKVDVKIENVLVNYLEQNVDFDFSALMDLAAAGKHSQKIRAIFVKRIADKTISAQSRHRYMILIDNAKIDSSIAVPLLKDFSKQYYKYYSDMAIDQLGNYGKKAYVTQPYLIYRLKQIQLLDKFRLPDPLIYYFAYKSHFFPSNLAPMNIYWEVMQSNEMKADSVVEALNKIGSPYSEIISLIEKQVFARDSFYSTSAIDTLGDFGEVAVDTIPTLLRAYKYYPLYGPFTNKDHKESIINALYKMGKPAMPLLIDIHFDPELKKYLPGLYLREDENYGKLIEHIRVLKMDALPCNIELLEHKSSAIRQAAALGIAELGSEANSAVPALEKALKDHPEDRKVFKRALSYVRQEK